MLDEKEIDIEIARLEYTESSYPNYAKLADLYTIKNQMHQSAMPKNYDGYSMAVGSLTASETSATIERYGNSDFLAAIAGKDSRTVWKVIDELMDTLKVVNLKVYNSVMAKIQSY